MDPARRRSVVDVALQEGVTVSVEGAVARYLLMRIERRIG